MSGDEVRLTDQQIGERLQTVPGWTYRSGSIQRTYRTDGWRGTLLVVNAIAFVCEAADHHPNLQVSWPAVEVSLSTHSAGGITVKDFEVAELIERQVLWKPGPESHLSGPAKPFVRGL